MSDHMPQRIQSYQIVRKLGEGGMGAVFEGLNPQIGRRAAIKVLLPQYTNDKEQVTRFFNEARASNLVRHPSLVDVYECGYAEDGTAFIIMEFLDGESLRARSKRQGILGPIAIPLVRQMATALAATPSTPTTGRWARWRSASPDQRLRRPSTITVPTTISAPST